MSELQSNIMTVGLSGTMEMVPLLAYMYLVNKILKAIFLSSTFTPYDYFSLPYNTCIWRNSVSEACLFLARSKQSITVAS